MEINWLILWNISEWTIRLVMVPVILRRRLAPSTSLAWMAVVFFIPVFGLVAYTLVGDNRLGKRRIRLRRQLGRTLRQKVRRQDRQVGISSPAVGDELRPLILQAERSNEMALVAGNTVDLIADTEESIDRMIEDIDAAVHHVHMLMYIFADDETGRRVVEALNRAAKRGVICRLLVDSAGSWKFFRDGKLMAKMVDAGVEVREALPVRLYRVLLRRIDLRNHRKILVVDGRIAYTGSQNVVDADYGTKRAGAWIDLMARFTGPIVRQLQIIFIEDWYFETEVILDQPEYFPEPRGDGEVVAQTVATGPGERADGVPRVFHTAMNVARKRLIITSPYFVPDEPMLISLVMAAERGVQVDLVLPNKSDNRLADAACHATFDRLLHSGVNVHLHQKGMLHAKTMSVDDAFAGLGTSNMDVRSFYLNFEVNVLMYGREVTAKLRAQQIMYINDSRQLTIEEWEKRPATTRYMNAAAALLSPIL